MMTALLFLLAWLLCGFAGAYIGHRWVLGGKEDTTLGRALLMTLAGLGGLVGMLIAGAVMLSDSNTLPRVVVFKRKSK